MKGTIKSKDDIERLFRTGRRSSSYLVTVLASTCPVRDDERGRCAFIAGKRMGNAPLRNRCKRVMRASVDRLGGPWEGFDLVFVAHKEIAHADPSRIDVDMRKQLAKLGVA